MKKILKHVLATTILTGLLLSNGMFSYKTTASAAVTGKNDDTNPRNEKTNVFFQLKGPDITKSISPASPMDLNKTDTSGYNRPTTENGALTLDAVPNDMRFAPANINPGQLEYDLKLQTDSKDNKITQLNQFPMTQVSDRRDANDHSWNLTASLSMNSEVNKGIKSERLTMPTSNQNNEARRAYSNVNNYSNDKPIVNSNLTLNANNEKPTGDAMQVMNADRNGAGTWVDLFDSSRINLYLAVDPNAVTSNEKAKQKDGYNSTITWTLSDGPGSSSQPTSSQTNTPS